jgi:hypothetical protein
MRPALRNKLFILLPFALQFIICVFPVFAQEAVSWKQLAQNLQRRIDNGSLGREVSISFQNSPHKPYMEDELMAYTFRSDGMVIIQMNDQVKEVKVPPNELLWLAKFLVEHKLSELPDKETEIPGSAAFSLNIKLGNIHKGVWLYNKGNNSGREIIWEYLLHLGQSLLENAGMRDKDLAILPVCQGINKIEELDPNNDGLIEWMHLRIGFYAFKAGEFTFDFSGVRQTFYLAQGSTEKDFFLNTYLLNAANELKKEYLFLVVDSQPPYPTGAYRLDLGLAEEAVRRKNLRVLPDYVLEGPAKGSFPLRLHQSVIVEVKKNQFESGNRLLRFTLSEITAEGVRLTGKDEPVLLAREEKIPLADFGCISSLFGLGTVDPKGAVFEVNWNVPEAEGVHKKVEYFQEALADDKYQGDKETARASLDFCRDCLQLLDCLQDLKIIVIYSTPAQN